LPLVKGKRQIRDLKSRLEKKKIGEEDGCFYRKNEIRVRFESKLRPISAPSRLISTAIRYDANPLRRTDERAPAETIEMEYFQRTNVVFKK
jgi:hypothetical protein